MKLTIVASGGGHFSPALAVIQQLPKDVEPLVIGRKYSLEGDKAVSLEYQVSKSLGIRFEAITAGRLQRKFTKRTVFSLLKVPYGIAQAFLVLRREKPDVLLSFGGYVSVPVVMAARILGIPIIVHEQTLGAGFSNRLASLFAKKVCVSWDVSKKFFPPEKTIVTGLPLRKEVFASYALRKKDMPLLLISGGSLGSHAVNVLIEGCIDELLDRFHVVHQAGDAREFMDYERLVNVRSTLSKEKKDRYEVVKFLGPVEFDSIVKSADLVVGRCGIGTVTELLFLGKMALLIPLPYAQSNEQFKNALFFKESGLGEVVEQKGLTSKILFGQIATMIEKREEYYSHAKEARNLVKTDATARLVALILSFQTPSR